MVLSCPKHLREFIAAWPRLAACRRPRDELIRTRWNLDADEIAEKYPIKAIAVVLSDLAKRVFVAGEAGNDLAVLVLLRESVGQTELFGDLF